MARCRIILLSAILVVASIVFATVVVEIFLQIIDYPKDGHKPTECESQISKMQDAYSSSVSIGAYPANYMFSLCSEEFNVSYITDKYGYLGNNVAQSTRNVLVFGDSFAFGYGIRQSDSFAGLLNAYNAGMWGVSYPKHALAFDRIAPITKPRYAIWTIYPPHLVSVSARGWLTHYLDAKRFPILSYFVTQFNKTKLSTVLLMTTGWGLNRSNYFTPEWTLYDAKDNSLKGSYDIFEKSVQTIANIARKNNIKLIPLIIPSKNQLALKNEHKRPLLIHCMHSLDAELPIKRLSGILERNGVAKEVQIDLLPFFSQRPWRDYYFKTDAHFNEKGNRAVAAYLKVKIGQLD